VGTTAAPRYPDELLAAIGRLDDPAQPYAETCRRVARWAEEQGYTRPGLAGLRRHVARERERQAALRAIRAHVAERLVLGLRVDAFEVADRVDEANRRRWES
jgi:hypothetical protein